MKDIAVFGLTVEPSKTDLLMLSQLNLMLEKMGSKIEATELLLPDGIHHQLIISFDAEAAKEYQSRGAGRKQKQVEQELTVGEVRLMLQKRTAEDVARELGVSRSTLFRRLKQDDEFFF